MDTFKGPRRKHNVYSMESKQNCARNKSTIYDAQVVFISAIKKHRKDTSKTRADHTSHHTATISTSIYLQRQPRSAPNRSIMAPSTAPSTARFFLGDYFQDPGLRLPEYSILSREDQEHIRSAINSDWMKRTKTWEAMSESEHFIDRLSFLLKVCAFHKDHWDKPGQSTAFWRRAKKSSKWPPVLDVTTVRNLVIVLFEARMRYVAATGNTDTDPAHPVSAAAQAFHQAMKVRFSRKEDFQCWLHTMKEAAGHGCGYISD